MGLRQACGIQVNFLFSFRKNSFPSTLPEGFILESELQPSPRALNRLLSKCNEKTHSFKRLEMALERSFFHISILEKKTGKLSGFVRATSDNGLNANLWNLVAEPGVNQKHFLYVLVNQALGRLRRDLPGCSISVSAPQIAINALQEQVFLFCSFPFAFQKDSAS